MTKSRMTLEEAAKKAKTEKPQEAYIELNIGDKLILPYKDGVKILEAMAMAEKLVDWGDCTPISPLSEYSVQAKVMSASEYQRRRMATLMGMSWRDFQKAEEEAKQEKEAA